MPPNDTSRNRTYEQLPDTVPGFDGAVDVPQPVLVSSTFPGVQVVKVSAATQQIAIMPMYGQLLLIDARSAVASVLVRSKPSSAAVIPGEVYATVQAGSYGLVVSDGSGWRNVPNGPTGVGGVTYWFETLADMAAAPGPAVKTLAWQIETGAPYEFLPGDVTAIDGWYSVGNNGGTAGRWILKSDVVSIGSTGVDQGVRLSSAIAALAGKARIQLRPETFVCTTKIIMQSFLDLDGHADTVIMSNLVDSGLGVGGYLQSTFFVEHLALGPAANISVQGNPGDFTMRVSTNPPAVGDYVYLGSGQASNCVQQGRVLAVAGAGPWDVTLNTALVRTFPANTSVMVPSRIPTEIHIRGNGMVITPSNAGGRSGGDRAVEIACGLRCSVEGVRVNGDGGGAFVSLIMSYDDGSQDCDYIDVQIDGNGSPVGLAYESSLGGRMIRNVIKNCGTDTITGGALLLSVVDLRIDQLRVESCSVALQARATGTGDLSSQSFLLDDMFVIGNTQIFSNDAIAPLAATLRNIRGRHDAHSVSAIAIVASPFSVNSNNKGTTILFDGFDMQTAPGAQQILFDMASIDNKLCDLRITNALLRNFDANTIFALTDSYAGAQVSTLRIDHTRTIEGGKVGVYLLGKANYWEGEQVDFQTATTPYNFDATSTPSFGTFVVNNAIAVDVPFPPITAASRVTYNRTIDGGAPGIAPKYTVTAGSKFTITGVNGDTSTYRWKVL